MVPDDKDGLENEEERSFMSGLGSGVQRRTTPSAPRMPAVSCLSRSQALSGSRGLR
ncbi:hypothetical protein KH5H1_56640 [Corallococcus caeni]|nr:hypothetical protein KH5H1_56640 [Corallococcus sp. KH5-1]